MRILIIADHLLTSRVATGGDRVFVELAKRWKTLGAETMVLIPALAVEQCQDEIAPSRIYSIDTIIDRHGLASRYLCFILPAYLIRTIKACALMRSIECDVVYTTGDFFCDVIPAAYYKLRNPEAKWIARIYHVNEFPFKRRSNPFLFSTVSFFLQRFSFIFIKRFADSVFLLNRGVEEQLATLGFLPEQMQVAGAGIRFREIDEIDSQSESVFDACFLARLNPTKGVFDVPLIWERVVKTVEDAKLMIIGSGSQAGVRRLERELKKRGLDDNVSITGFLPDRQVWLTLKSSRVFISPSYEEGWGMSVCEAMACKVPVVAYDLPVYKELFDDAVVAVPSGSIEQFADQIVYLLQDPESGSRRGEYGYTIASRYDWDKIADRDLELIKSLVAEEQV
ncbi:MAG: glycosyltransferase [Actinomycetota bacterium]